MTMTDEPDSVDELISRYLDGEATEAEIVRVESDPALLGRAESMRAAIEAVAAPVDIPVADLDRIRAAAVAASTTTEQVTDLAAAAAAKRQSAERRNRFMAVAAAFVMLAVGVVAIRALPGGDDDEADTATAEAGDTDSSADESDDGDDAGDLSVESSATADTAEMAEEDDMAEEEMAEESADEMAEADMAMDDSGDDDMAEEAPAEEAEGERTTEEDAPTEALPFAAVDLLPDELPPFGDAQALVDAVLDGYVENVDLEAGVGVADEELFAGLCQAAIELLDGAVPAPITSVESLTTEVAGTPVTVIVAVGEDGSSAVLTHPIGDCDTVEIAAALEPS